MPHLLCQDTQATFPLDSPIWRSPAGGLLDLVHEGTFDPGEVTRRPANLWRYHEAIPGGDLTGKVSFAEGMTPLVPLSVGNKSISVKLDYLFPSGSYKDRGATVLLTQARALGISSVVQDSSGNAGAAVATYAALAGIGCDIFVPADTSPAKLHQMKAVGAKLHLVPGTREDTAAAAFAAAQEQYYASHVWNPFFFHGTKTFAYEIAEQLGWNAPDTLVLPAGNGTLLIGAWIGFQDLLRMGIIRHMPRLIGVQAARCEPLTQAWAKGEALAHPVTSQPTLAEGIAIAEPRRAAQMLDYVRQSQGQFLSVEEEQIEETLRWLLKQGYFVEPTSAAVMAGAIHYLSQAEKDEQVVTVLTGHGLKASEKIAKLFKENP